VIAADHLAGVIAKLALNYNRAFEDQDAVYAVFDMWNSQLSAVLPDDLDQAVAGLLADPSVKFFPTIADMRARVIQASQGRHQAAAASPDGRGTVACLTCLDSGWLDAGTDDAGSWWVRPCPQGCLPPVAHRAHHRTHRGRRKAPGESTQLALVSDTTLERAVAETARMIGEHDGRLGAF